MLDVTAEGRVNRVLTNLGGALAAHDLDRAIGLFQDDCYWRDLVAFTWNIKTLEGKDAVRAMLEAQLPGGEAEWTGRSIRMPALPMKAASRAAGSLSRPTSFAATATSASRTGRSGRCSPPP